MMERNKLTHQKNNKLLRKQMKGEEKREKSDSNENEWDLSAKIEVFTSIKTHIMTLTMTDV